MSKQSSRKTIGLAVAAALGMAAAAPASAGLPNILGGEGQLDFEIETLGFSGLGALAIGAEAGIAGGVGTVGESGGTAGTSGSFGGTVVDFTGVPDGATVFVNAVGGGLGTASTGESGTINAVGLGGTSGEFSTNATGQDSTANAAVAAGAVGFGIVSENLTDGGSFNFDLEIPD